MTSRAPLTRAYVLGVGTLLIGQGAAGLVVRAFGRQPHTTTHLLSDPAHSTIHLMWGGLLLASVLTRDDRQIERTLLAFGIFYVGLLALGVLVHHPFGLIIDGAENAFHAVVGPLALGVWMRSAVRRPGRSRSAEAVEVP